VNANTVGLPKRKGERSEPMWSIHRIKQTEFGFGNGNCWQACIASILKMELNDVPHFAKDTEGWWKNTQKFMADRGLYLLEVPIENGIISVSEIPDGIHLILSGKSPRGDFNHSVIGKKLKEKFIYEFDPHPDETFLDGPPKFASFVATLRTHS
jgi:hypothetical protein